MTKENISRVRYLTELHLREAHAVLCEISLKHNRENMPPFGLINHGAFESLLAMPKQSLYGKELYPEIYDKAAIIYYTVVKQHIFINGNKRLAAASLLWFITMNGYQLDVAQDELTNMTTQLAESDALLFAETKSTLTDWLRMHMQRRNSSELERLGLTH